jgi:hypothetical protein
MNRRNFLKLLGISIIAPSLVYDSIKDLLSDGNGYTRSPYMLSWPNEHDIVTAVVRTNNNTIRFVTVAYGDITSLIKVWHENEEAEILGFYSSYVEGIFELGEIKYL